MDPIMQTYKASLAAMGISGWPAVEEKLATKDADLILGLLVEHAEATRCSNECHQAWIGITQVTHPKQKLRWAAEDEAHQAYRKYERIRKETGKVLDIALVGEQAYLESIRKREEQEEVFERAIQEDVYD